MNQNMMKRFPPEIQQFADLFCRAQIERQAADYGTEGHYVRDDVVLIAVEAFGAIVDFRRIPVKDRRAFAVYLLFDRRK